MKSVLSLTLHNRYSITILPSLISICTDLKKCKTLQNPVLCLTPSTFSRLQSFKSPSRFFSINPLTLQLAFIALPGSGSSPTKQISSSPPILSPPDSELLKLNQQKAIQLSMKISETFQSSLLSMKDIYELEAINPFECAAPFAVGLMLLKKFEISQCWSEPMLSEERAEIARIARRHFMAYFMRNESRFILEPDEKRKIVRKIEGMIERVERNNEKTPEIGTLLDLTVINRMISRAKDTKMWWQTVIYEVGDLVNISRSIKILDPTPAINKIFRYFKDIGPKLRGSYEKYMFKLEFLDNQSQYSNDFNEIEAFILNEFDDSLNLTWEEIYILLDYVQHRARKRRLTDHFVMNVVLVKISELWRSKSVEIRVKCAILLKEFRGHEDQGVKEMAELLHWKAKLGEKEESVIWALGRYPDAKNIEESETKN